MVAICVVGAQWGDEGKGKVIDILAEKADIVVRFSGGNNAGHTVVIEGQRYAVHLLPSGVLRPGIVNVLAGGVVVDPWHLSEEIQKLRQLGMEIHPGENLLVSKSAHLILPYHRMQDRITEELRGRGKIGTTGRGIGPAYRDRASRAGLRFGDLADREYLQERLHSVVAEKNRFLTSLGREPIEAATLFDELTEVTRELLPAGADTGLYLRKQLGAGRRLIFEGAQGMMLDVDLGTFPYVTSSSVGIAGIGAAGISPRAIDEVILVSKAYCTRVGEGPLPTEQAGEVAEHLRERGQEYGTTTGRPRRCGWFDAVAGRYAVDISGADALHLTNLDVLSGLPEIRVAIAYEGNGKKFEVFPAGIPSLDALGVHYVELQGWQEEISGIRQFDELPAAAREYVAFLEKELAVPMPLISVGPGREQVIRRG